jgi:hypothetical protein
MDLTPGERHLTISGVDFRMVVGKRCFQDEIRKSITLWRFWSPIPGRIREILPKIIRGIIQACPDPLYTLYVEPPEDQEIRLWLFQEGFERDIPLVTGDDPGFYKRLSRIRIRLDSPRERLRL